MKHFFTFFLLLLATLCQAQFSLDHYHPQELIKELKLDSCTIYVQKEDGSLEIEQSYLYDSEGRETANHRYFQNFSFIYEYDAEGKKISSLTTNMNDGEKSTLFYNDNGLLEKRVTINQEGEETTRNIYYYNNEKLTKEEYYLYGNLHVVSIYSYDEGKNQKTEERTFRGNPQGKWVYKYNENGDLLSFTSYEPNEEISVKQEYKYNEEGLEVEFRILTDDDQLSQLYTTTYDEIGLIKYRESWTSIRNGNLETADYEKTVYVYK